MNRNLRSQPFAWTTKEAWEKIETLPYKQQVSCKMIYVSLSIISKKQKNTNEIEAYKFTIAKYGSMSEKTVQRYLPCLEELGIIKIERQDRKSNGKFEKCRIWLYDTLSTVGHLEDSSETVQRQFADTESDINNKETKEQKNKDIVIQVIDFLNQTAGKNFKSNTDSTIKSINGRMNDGYLIEDFKKVIKTKVTEWKGTEHEIYLRPSTLFSPTNFENYLNQKNETRKFGIY